MHAATFKDGRKVTRGIIAPKHIPFPSFSSASSINMSTVGVPLVLHPPPPHHIPPFAFYRKRWGSRGLFMSCCSQNNYCALMRPSGISPPPHPHPPPRCHLSQEQEKSKTTTERDNQPSWEGRKRSPCSHVCCYESEADDAGHSD